MTDNRQWSFDFNPDRCVQCYACEIACKNEHSVEQGVKWRKVLSVWQGDYPDVKNRNFSVSCLHCAYPACEAACPSDAIYKRAQDGIVFVDQEKCIGCQSCLEACPIDAPQFGGDEKMQKCDLCANRLSHGEEPACVSTCVSEALRLTKMDQKEKKRSEEILYETVKPFLSA